MTFEHSPDDAALAAEMRATAQTTILQWFANLLRVRIATQSPTQRALHLALLQEGLDQALASHATQTLASPSDSERKRGSLFKQAFTELSVDLLATMGRGLTEQEELAMR